MNESHSPGKFQTRVVKILKFIKLLRVEPFMFLVAFQYGLLGTPSSQLIQDKICAHWYNTSKKINYCLDLPSLHEEDSRPGHYKTRILADATEFGTYTSYATVLPSVIWAIFIGAWVDRYVKARKLLMIISVLGGIIENIIAIYLSLSWNTSVYYNLLLHIPKSIAGGSTASRIAIMHYMTSTTPPKLMAIRFMIYEICFTLALPIGKALGGYILVQKPTFHTGEIRNFTMCFIIALVFEVIALLWIVFMIDEKVARKQEMKIEMKIQGVKENESNKIKLRSDMSREDQDIHPIKLLFNLENIKSMVRTVTKKRPNKGRIQVTLLIVCLTIFISEFIGLQNVSAQFVQRVYLWTPDWNAYMGSISLVLVSLSSMTIIPLLSKVLKVADTKLALLGYIINFTSNIIKGTWLSPNAYYAAMAIGGINGAASIGTRSHLSKIVERDEMGKIMSFMSILDTLAPVVATAIFSYLFKYTVNSYPGIVYQVVAGLVLIPIYVMMWISLYTEVPLVEGEVPKQHYPDNEKVQGEGAKSQTKY